MSEDKKTELNEQETEARRDFIKKAAYIAPVIMTMKAAPAFAVTGSAATPPSKSSTPPSGP